MRRAAAGCRPGRGSWRRVERRVTSVIRTISRHAGRLVERATLCDCAHNDHARRPWYVRWACTDTPSSTRRSAAARSRGAERGIAAVELPGSDDAATRRRIARALPDAARDDAAAQRRGRDRRDRGAARRRAGRPDSGRARPRRRAGVPPPRVRRRAPSRRARRAPTARSPRRSASPAPPRPSVARSVPTPSRSSSPATACSRRTARCTASRRRAGSTPSGACSRSRAPARRPVRLAILTAPPRGDTVGRSPDPQGGPNAAPPRRRRRRHAAPRRGAEHRRRRLVAAPHGGRPRHR